MSVRKLLETGHAKCEGPNKKQMLRTRGEGIPSQRGAIPLQILGGGRGPRWEASRGARDQMTATGLEL